MDQFYSLDKLKKDNQQTWDCFIDESFFNQSVDIVSQSQRTLFSFLIMVTSHKLYNYGINDFCDNSINYTDKELGVFIDKLKSREF